MIYALVILGFVINIVLFFGLLVLIRRNGRCIEDNGKMLTLLTTMQSQQLHLASVSADASELVASNLETARGKADKEAALEGPPGRAADAASQSLEEK